MSDCGVCGNQVPTRTGRGRRSSFCSEECKRVNAIGRKRRHVRTFSSPQNCAACGASINTDPMAPVRKYCLQCSDTCSVPGCSEHVECRTLCRMHYRRLRNHGDVGSVGRFRADHPLVPRVGNRTLLAKTCTSCGRLLRSDYYSTRGKGKGWRGRCVECLYRKRERPRFEGNTREWYAKRQAEFPAERNGYSYTDTDYAVLADERLSLGEKAHMLRRSYRAVSTQTVKNSYKSRRQTHPRVEGQWMVQLDEMVKRELSV